MKLNEDDFVSMPMNTGMNEDVKPCVKHPESGESYPRIPVKNIKNSALEYFQNLCVRASTYANYRIIIIGMLDHAELNGFNPLSQKDCIQLALSFLESKRDLNLTTMSNLYKPIIMNVYTKFVRDVYGQELVITKNNLKIVRGTSKISNKSMHEIDDTKYIISKLCGMKDNEVDIVKKLNYCTLIFAIKMCYTTALRISDVLNLRVCDVFNDNKTIKDDASIVQQKTRKEITVPLRNVQSDIQELWGLHEEIYFDCNFSAHQNIRLIQVHKPLSSQSSLSNHEELVLYRHFKAMAERLLPKEDKIFSNFHGYRRGFATSTLKQFMADGKKYEGMDIVQNALSHSSINRTNVYISDLLKQQDKENITKKRIELQSEIGIL